MESPYCYSLTFRFDNPRIMSIQHNCMFNVLLQNINQLIYVGDCKRVSKLNYHHPVKIVNNHVVHDTVQVKFDSYVAQMIKCWKKKPQLLKPSL